MHPPRRIVCLTEETEETLYLLGAEARIVGVSGYAVRPPRVRREKPRVSAFISADIAKILALEPDLVLTFSDLQADIAAELIRSGVAVHAFNQRDIAGILAMVRILGALVGAKTKAEALATDLQRRRWLERDDFSSNRHPALAFCLSMIISETRFPLFGIMLYGRDRRSRAHICRRLRRPRMRTLSHKVRGTGSGSAS